jgi:hypothetical protein
VSVNPDYGQIEQVELVYCGDVIETFIPSGRKQLNNFIFNLEIKNKESGWFAVRANGIDYSLVHSGAIYINDKRGNSHCADKIEDEKEKMLNRLTLLSISEVDISKELELWKSKNISQLYENQREQLNKRIEKARDIYLQ